MKVIEKAPAKINLGLKIVSRRPDGFHDILSIFQTVTLFDTLELTESPETQLTCSDSTLPNGPDNLVLKAELALRNLFPEIPASHFDLQKYIPVGGGLGGGSSDAAAAFRGLVKLYDLDIEKRKLEELSATIGSDIPFLIRGGTAIISGRGELITSVEWPFDLTYVIIHPDVHISTAWAYRNLDNIGQNINQFEEMLITLKAGSITRDQLLDSLVNDFESSVFKHYPQLMKLRDALLDNGAEKALLTGSGACLYGIFISHDDAVRCSKNLRSQNIESFVAKTLKKL